VTTAPASDARAAALIDRLALQPHPEGGYYREIFRSALAVRTSDGRPVRSAVTTIYYLLTAGQHSGWHRVRSDEIWHFYDGDPLELALVSPAFDSVTRLALGPPDGTSEPSHTVPAGWWQAARPTGAFTLAGATVAPGFEFVDFLMARDDRESRDALLRLERSLASLL